MTTQITRSVDVPRVTTRSTDRFPDLAVRRMRRRALDVLRAFEVVGESCTCRMVMPDGAAVQVVAIYIARTGGRQFHAGIYHRDHGDPSVLHFASDRDLRNDPPAEVCDGRPCGLIALALDEDDAQTLCALCRRVAGRHSVAFRFRFAEWRPRFDLRTAEVIPPRIDERYGFTCATFVLAMLRSAIVEELLALDQWPVPELDDIDDRWQKKLVEMLCPIGASPAHQASVLAGIGARRVHPTDVAGGAVHPRQYWPVGFVDSRREGEQLAQRLQ